MECNVYICVSSTLLMGVLIEASSKIAVGSIVTKSVKGKPMVTGIPAKFMKDIFITVRVHDAKS